MKRKTKGPILIVQKQQVQSGRSWAHGLCEKECILWAHCICLQYVVEMFILLCPPYVYNTQRLREKQTSRDMLEFTLGGPQMAIHVCRLYLKTQSNVKNKHFRKELTCMSAGMSCLVCNIQPLSSPVSFQITSCICHTDRRHGDITTAPQNYRRLCSASLLAPPPGFDLKEGIQ